MKNFHRSLLPIIALCGLLSAATAAAYYLVYEPGIGTTTYDTRPDPQPGTHLYQLPDPGPVRYAVALQRTSDQAQGVLHLYHSKARALAEIEHRIPSGWEHIPVDPYRIEVHTARDPTLTIIPVNP